MLMLVLLLLQVGIIGDASVTVGGAVTGAAAAAAAATDCHGQRCYFMGRSWIPSWIPNRFQAALFTRPKAIESTGVLLFKVTIQN